MSAELETWLTTFFSSQKGGENAEDGGEANAQLTQLIMETVAVSAGKDGGANDEATLAAMLKENVGEFLDSVILESFIKAFVPVVMAARQVKPELERSNSGLINFSDSESDDEVILSTGSQGHARDAVASSAVASPPKDASSVSVASGIKREREAEDSIDGLEQPSSKRPRQNPGPGKARGWGGIAKKVGTASQPPAPRPVASPHSGMNPQAKSFVPGRNGGPHHSVALHSDRKPVPQSYVCKICGVPGHWIQDCPQKNAYGKRDSDRGMAGGSRRYDHGATADGEKIQGEVTMAKPGNDYCFIDNDVYAHKTVCRRGADGDAGWPVAQGDRVEYHRIDNSKHGKNKWKAVSFSVIERGPGFSETQAKRKQQRKERELALLAPPPDSTSSMLLLRGIPRHALNIGRINAFFEQFGEVTDVRMKRGRHENMAYVSFLNQLMARKAATSKQPVLGIRDITVQWAIGDGADSVSFPKEADAENADSGPTSVSDGQK